MKFYGVYKITNLLTSKFYIGSHVTTDLKDSYMGSSRWLTKDIKELGVENFKRGWLYIFGNKKDMLEKENELIKEEFDKNNNNIYNKHRFGGWNTSGMTCVKDITGKKFLVDINDDKFISKEYVGIATRKVIIKDIDGKNKMIDIDDARYLNGELKPFMFNKVVVKFPNETKGFLTSVDDIRLLTGEIVGITFGKTLSKKHGEKIGEKNSIHQKSKGNSSFGKPWIYNEELKQNKKIPLEQVDTYISQGWKKGRKLKYNKNIKQKINS